MLLSRVDEVALTLEFALYVETPERTEEYVRKYRFATHADLVVVLRGMRGHPYMAPPFDIRDDRLTPDTIVVLMRL